jgi:selenophosphate synthetase-related protein
VSDAAILVDLVEAVRSHPGLVSKASLAMVVDVLGGDDPVRGPGDDGAVLEVGDRKVVTCGEALWPPFVDSDPRGAGIAAVVANVNDLAAMGARPLGLVDTIVAPEATARRALEGIAHAAALYRVPILGGHLTVYDGPASLSAFGLGVASRVLSAANVAPGQILLVAACVEGRMRPDFAYFSSIAERGERLGDDVRILADVADAGLCVAAKDVSMSGVLGSLALLLEISGCGATVDVAALPRPEGVPLTDWSVAFPTFSFVLAAPSDRVDACRRAFRRRGLECEACGVVDSSGIIRLRLGRDERQLVDVIAEPLAGRRPGAARPTSGGGGAVPSRPASPRRRRDTSPAGRRSPSAPRRAAHVSGQP